MVQKRYSKVGIRKDTMQAIVRDLSCQMVGLTGFL